jgi:DNA-binding NarL/FixJ family response regulator
MKSKDLKRVGVIAADPLRGLGLEAILNDMDGLTAAPVDLPRLLREDPATLRLEAAVLDARSPGPALLDVLGRLRRARPGLKVIVVGESLEFEDVQTVIGAGAKGYLAETAREEEIRMALDVVLDGSVWAPRKVLARLLETGGVSGTSGSSGPTAAVTMTPRELEVLELLKDGGTNRGIARAMGIDETTVKAHLGRMMRKTGATNRVELTLRAVERSAEDARWETPEP